MAKLQLSISHTFILDTDEWPQSELDTLYAQVNTETPTAEQLEDAIQKLLSDNGNEFWDEHIDLGEIDAQNVKVVCIDPSFNRFAKPEPASLAHIAEKEDEEDVKTETSGKPEVASKPETSIKAPTTRSTKTSTSTSNRPSTKK